MKVLIVLGAFLVTIVAVFSAPPILDIAEGRIVGGQLANSTQFPYQVALKVQHNETAIALCGGSLIDASWVLTAAHCVYRILNGIAYLGAANWMNVTQIIRFTGRNVYIHPRYNRVDKKHDIALIKLIAKPIINEYVQIVMLSNSSSGYNGNDVVIAGWGKNLDNSSSTSDLRYIVSKVVPNIVCKRAYGYDKLNSNHICMSTTVSQNTCVGDSGGPLVLLSGEKAQIGVLAGGSARSCETGKPAIFTRVSSYLPWIRNITSILPE